MEVGVTRHPHCSEPGVVEWAEEARFKCAYKTMRIPEGVLKRVHRRLSKTARPPKPVGDSFPHIASSLVALDSFANEE
jgi:hypothetical protein